MAKLNKIDSNLTGLRYAVEQSIGVLPGGPVFIPLEPNTYKEFGGQVSLVARRPINPSRQLKKGVITDLNATAGWNTDMTQTNLQDILQGFFFADTRIKGSQPVTAVDGATHKYSIAATAGYLVGALVFGENFTNVGNNVLGQISAVVANTSVSLAAGLVTEAAPPATAVLKVAGFRGAAADLTIDASGPLPRLLSTVLNFTTLGLSVGEWMFIGGDVVTNQFATAANNGFARVRAIAANAITFDKTASTMVTDTGVGKSIDLYFGSVLKNEQGALIKRRTYTLERTLGYPDDSNLAQIQSEYVHGSTCNDLTFNIPTANKLTVDLGFVGTKYEARDAVTGVIAGTRPTLQDSDAFNTSSDFSRIKLAIVSQTNAAPTPMFAFLTTLTLNLKNNITPAKAVGVLGAFEVNVGTFELDASMTAYFADVAAVQAVQNNADVTLDMAVVKNNAGFLVDFPLIALGDARANVVQDKAIELPLTMNAATAAKIDTNLNHTVLMMFWDYLPSLADT